MQENNRTAVSEFFLLGFQVSKNLKFSLFSLLLLVYCVTICGNFLIITLVYINKTLHTPMYFFISQLSVSDILLTTDIAPNMFHILLNNRGTITFIGCITQFYFFSAAEIFECLLLTVMSYDRYVAICNPLHYISIMTSTLCVKFVALFWLLSFFTASTDIFTLSSFEFCGPNIIDHFFCDLVPLQEMSCSDTFPIKVQTYLQSIPLLIIPSIIIVISYVHIVRIILRIPSNMSRQKAFSTCSSHLIVVFIFYWTIFSVYVIPTKSNTSDVNKITSLLYTVFTPLVNPIIYSFRNKDIKKAVQETIKKYL
ncbi:olfactory receptor 5G9-like [Eleutherodactylus coqui]|uniref:olfactory receptor 5G9-like n=1 Tax=Eleutherodactylus coqui TaxID=57060 RepID=UPI00346192F8